MHVMHVHAQSHTQSVPAAGPPWWQAVPGAAAAAAPTEAARAGAMRGGGQGRGHRLGRSFTPHHHSVLL